MADPVARALVDRVDRLMARAGALLPAAAPDETVLPGGQLRAAPTVPGSGAALSAVAADAGGGLGQAHAAVGERDERAAAAVSSALAAGVQARRRIELLREQTRASAEAVLALTDSGARMRLLVSMLDERVAAMADQLGAAGQTNAAAAAQLRELAAGYLRSV